MKRKTMFTAAGLLAAFTVWTAALCLVDLQAIGPEGSVVGFASLNQFIHHLTGVHMILYIVTDWLGLAPIGFAAGFALLGLIQWIQRRSIVKVDFSILVLGGFYLAVIAAYVLFEVIVVNYRPVLIDGYLEASYPSSTTMLVLCVMPTSAMQLNARIRHGGIRRCIVSIIYAFTVLMVIGRLVSGVHWLTDIIGGGLLSAGMVTMYQGICGKKIYDNNRKNAGLSS